MDQDTDRFIRATRGNANPLDDVEQKLRNTIFGQERAIEAVVRVLNRARFGFSAGNPRRPRATLLFLGPTGVGKTATARRLAQLLRPDGEAFLKVDCSLFSQGHEVSALVGAPPSYVGRDQKPLLNPDIIEQDNSVVLFDEIEKGQPELWNLLLQIMEDGEILLLNGGRRVSFQSSIVILTTNVGAKEMVDYLDRRTIGFRTAQKDVEATGQQIYQIGFEALQRVFQPEWINRLDEIIAFRPLSSDILRDVLERAGIVTRGEFRMVYFMMHAELDGIVCSGARRTGFVPGAARAGVLGLCGLESRAGRAGGGGRSSRVLAA
jgi:ATP-dependent Clp protease ATP-binding subunit ClpA